MTKRNPDDYDLTDTQRQALKKVCPNCENGQLYPVQGNDDEGGEDYLWCGNCLLSMDGSGGYTC